jgi:hypothetical protein
VRLKGREGGGPQIQFPKFHAKFYYYFDVMAFIHFGTIFHQFSSMDHFFSFIKLNLKHNTLARQEHNFCPHYQKFVERKNTHFLNRWQTPTNSYHPHTHTHKHQQICIKIPNFPWLHQFVRNMDTLSNSWETYTNVMQSITLHSRCGKTRTHAHTHTHKWVIRIYICWIDENKLAVSQDLMIF